jgi:hypothetical protein
VPEPTTPETPEALPSYNASFAIIAAIVLLLMGVAVLWRPMSVAWEITKDDWKGTDGDKALTATLSLPLIVVGGVLVLIGTWMAVVEWRGRFREPEPARVTTRGLTVDLAKTIDAIAKLRGAALVLVIGAVLMLGAAWVAHSTADEAADAAAGATGPTGPTGPTG